jgi:predicted phage terminase large subunit-like protein
MIQGYEDKALPLSLRMYGASDYATMEGAHGKREPDFTEHGVVGVDRVGDLWFTDWWYGQVETDAGIAQFIRLLRLWKPVIRWANEGGIIDKAIGPAIRSAMQHANTFVAVEQLTSIDDKSIKLQAFHARATARTVHFPLRRKWTEHVVDQLCRFPGGKHDDACDVCGLIGRLVDKMTDASVPLAQAKPLLVPFTAAWIEYGSNEKPKVRYW